MLETKIELHDCVNKAQMTCKISYISLKSFFKCIDAHGLGFI